MRTSNPTLSESAFTRLGAATGQTAGGVGYADGPRDPFGREGVSGPAPIARTDAFTV